MVLYDLLLGVEPSYLNPKGKIWCSDGSFIRPDQFRKLGDRWSASKYPVGYGLNDNVAVPIIRENLFRSWYLAHKYCNDCIKVSDKYGTVNGYLPSEGELSELYDSIMYGRMMKDLITAGVYEECNYRLEKHSSWGYMWTSKEYDMTYAGSVGFYGAIQAQDKSNLLRVIPFFKV